MKIWRAGYWTLGVFAIAAVGCGKADLSRDLFGAKRSGDRPVVASVATVALPSPGPSGSPAGLALADAKAAAAGVTPASTAVSGVVVYRKAQLFNREFLYGFDLQYSTGSDDKLSLIPQAQSLGHIPCFYRRLGDDLQLVADQRRLFESDINHPELLLAVYRIVAEDEATLTVKFASGGLVLNEVLNGPAAPTPVPGQPAEEAAGADPLKQVWIRSLAFDPNGEYLLQESALQVKNGGVQTFLESVFPRANLVAPGDVGLEANAAVEPAAARFRFLAAEDVYVDRLVGGETVRKKTKFASRFNLREGQTIDWYVTANIPEKFMPVVKSGVEGWNRYFQAEFGRNVVRFSGRLPADIKLGDPRYNVINFDSVAEAGAAYESQATDPLTGFQSHSLIYLPHAWYNIGAELWKKRSEAVYQPTGEELHEALSPKAPGFAFAPGRRILACAHTSGGASLPAEMLSSSLIGSGDTTVPADVDAFSKRLMIATLFHEVGHALGLDHNFKGSLAFEPAEAESGRNPVSWSVMDYNYYQNEQTLFKEIGGTDGPLLEYDRQVLSALYHGGKEIKESDVKLPACNDAEADAVEGGVDPLCLRYDSEKDPTKALVHAYHNVTADNGAQGVTTKTLAQVLRALAAPVAVKFSSPAAVADAAALDKEATALSLQVGELINFYLAAGAQSLSVNLKNNVKSLHLWKDGVGVADEAAHRARYTQVLKEALALRSLPAAPQIALQALSDTFANAVQSNAALGATQPERAAVAAKAALTLNSAITKRIIAILSKMRSSSYAGLGFDLKNPYALQVVAGGDASGYEDLAFEALTAGLFVGLDAPGATGTYDPSLQAERLLAATALLTFKDVAANYTVVTDRLDELAKQALKAHQSRQVTDIRQLSAKLK